MDVIQARPVPYKFLRQETQKEILMAYSFRNPSDGIIKHYLETSKIIAVVGLSDREDTTSHRVSKEMQERGYRIIPCLLYTSPSPRDA